MTTQYNVETYIHGINGFGAKYSDTIYSATLAMSTNTSLTVPSTLAIGLQASASTNKFLAIINSSSADDTFYAVNNAAALPAGGSFAAVHGKLLNPSGEGVLVNAGDTIQFKSAGTPSVTVAFYSLVE